MEPQTIVVKTKADFLIIALFEAVGTLILTLGMNFGYKTGPDAVSSGLFVAILVTYRITGSHLNAGVTFGVAIVEGTYKTKKGWKIIGTYILSQIIGSYLGMMIAYFVMGHDASMDMEPSPDHTNMLYVIIVEFIFSWIFLTIYLHAKVDWVAPSQDFGLRAFTMMAVAYSCTAMSQGLTGGALNPTIGLCGTTFRLMVRNPETEPLNIKYIAGYMIGPLLSGILAGFFISHFAIKVTPASVDHSGSPFLAPKHIKGLNDTSSVRNTEFSPNEPPVFGGSEMK